MNSPTFRPVATIAAASAALLLMGPAIARAETPVLTGHDGASDTAFVVDTSMAHPPVPTLLLLLHQPWASIAPNAACACVVDDLQREPGDRGCEPDRLAPGQGLHINKRAI